MIISAATIVVRIETVPGSVLLPNNRRKTYWAIAQEEIRRLRGEAYIDTWNQKPEIAVPPDADVSLKVRVLWPKDRKVPDLDGTLSACKPALDGLCQALGIDDRIISGICVSQGRAEHTCRDGEITVRLRWNLAGPQERVPS